MMPAGTYFVGDLCCVFSFNDWTDACNSTFIRDGVVRNGELTLPDGRRVAIYSTAYGDGTYLDSAGNDYGVDSGSLGCILLSDIKIDASDDPAFQPDPNICGTVHHFEEEFKTEQLGDGKIMFGHVIIDTAPEQDEDDYFEVTSDE